MLRNFFRTTLRNLWRSKGFSVINIAGLAIGMAAAILILLWVHNEYSTDRFYTHSDRIYQVYSRDQLSGCAGPYAKRPWAMSSCDSR